LGNTRARLQSHVIHFWAEYWKAHMIVVQCPM